MSETMTREQILAMEPSRELDRLVGQHVMKLDIVPDALPQLPRYYLPEYEQTYHRDVPLYSSDISSTWEVIGKMDEKKFDLKLIISGQYREVSYGDKTVVRIGEAHAICLCALLAVLDL